MRSRRCAMKPTSHVAHGRATAARRPLCKSQSHSSSRPARLCPSQQKICFRGNKNSWFLRSPLTYWRPSVRSSFKTASRASMLQCGSFEENPTASQLLHLEPISSNHYLSCFSSRETVYECYYLRRLFSTSVSACCLTTTENDFRTRNLTRLVSSAIRFLRRTPRVPFVRRHGCAQSRMIVSMIGGRSFRYFLILKRRF